METSDYNGDDAIATIKDLRKQLESRVEAQHTSQVELFSSLQFVVPEIVHFVDLSVKVVSLFNNRPFNPTPLLPPNPSNPNLRVKKFLYGSSKSTLKSKESKRLNDDSTRVLPSEETRRFKIEENGNHLTSVRSMIAGCLLRRVPFAAIDSSTVLRKLENDHNLSAAEKGALRELGGESGETMAVEMAMRSMAEDNCGVNLDEFVVSGKSSVMVWGIDQSRLIKELPESLQQQFLSSDNGNQNHKAASSGPGNFNATVSEMGNASVGPGDSQMSGFSTMFPGVGPPGPMMGPRAMGMMGMSGGMMGLQRPQMGNAPIFSPNTVPQKMNTDEDELKDLEAMLNKKSFKEMQKSKTGEELLDLIQRPTAKETAMAAKFKTKGGSQVREYCTALTKEAVVDNLVLILHVRRSISGAYLLYTLI